MRCLGGRRAVALGPGIACDCGQQKEYRRSNELLFSLWVTRRRFLRFAIWCTFILAGMYAPRSLVKLKLTSDGDGGLGDHAGLDTIISP